MKQRHPPKYRKWLQLDHPRLCICIPATPCTFGRIGSAGIKGPPTTTMDTSDLITVGATAAGAAMWKGYRAYEDNRPRPYSFGYVAQAIGGSSSRQEVGDGNGAVQGVYTLNTPEGGQRKVKYTADAAGFRAVVDTNEPGTQSESPADVALRSSSPPAYLLAAKYGPSGSSYGFARPRAVYGGAGALYGGGAAGYGAAGLYGGLGGRGAGVYTGGAGVRLLGKHAGWH
ncbi:hypothetical protein HPB50_012023 [Hyalomma asiaticum]|uniref:Uncharacterized protein n=1 Tax=Hyalomma asiaticum TaxID=266040 RepID=A0ACB7TIN3_HYAAI|nr:hypothetical protein HPB50_012023 [Hyalomma asiaticum]